METVWKQIDFKGLEMYQISNKGAIRKALTKKYLVKQDDGGKEVVKLLHRKKEKIFTIRELMLYTFGEEEPTFEYKQKKDNFYSDNEWDYGKGTHKGSWKILKRQIRNLESV